MVCVKMVNWEFGLGPFPAKTREALHKSSKDGFYFNC